MISDYKYLDAALNNLCPNAQYIIKEFPTQEIKWCSEIPQPSDEIINKEIEVIKKYLEAINNRKKEYPSIQEQLDDLFHAGAFSKEMTEKIQSIKNKYPVL